MPAFVPASARTMAVFEVFAREKRELMVSDVARMLDLADSSCSDLLHTLTKVGYLVRTAKTRRFYPTGRLYETAVHISKNDPLYLAGREMAEMLSERTGESAFCGLLDNGAVKVLASTEGRHPLRYVLTAGERIALHASALGKSILGGLELEEMRRQVRLKPMRKVARCTITDPQELEQNVLSQRERGWYSVQEEGNDGVTSFALPVSLGSTQIAVSIAGPIDRMREKQDAYLEILHHVVSTVIAND